jgi:diaminopimelate epimerase
MTGLTLTKHHGLGNDFLVLLDRPAGDLPALSRRLCDRRTGVGADGLLLAEPVEGYAARMTLFNPDGSRAEMSGNGIRCLAQALAARSGDLTAQTILTDAGPRGVERPVAHLDLGNPHTVVGVDDVAAIDLLALGRRVPDVNLEIIEPGPEPNAVTMRVHERGAGITRACGTGAAAAAWAAARWGLVDVAAGELVVHMDGGSARVGLHRPEPGHVTLTGPATFVATITVP